MARKKDFLDAYSSDSSEPSSGEGDGLDPSAADENSEFRTNHRRKRRRTGQEARDDAALGVFGSDSEYEDQGSFRGRGRSLGGRSSRPLRAKGVGFVKSGGGEEDVDMQDDEDDEEEEDEEEEPVKEDLDTFAGLRKRVDEDEMEEDEDTPRVGLGGGSMGRSMQSRGLGSAYPEEEEEEDPSLSDKPTMKFGLGKGNLFKGFAKAASTGSETPAQTPSGGATPDHRGLGFNPATKKPAEPAFNGPLGRGFVSSLAQDRLHEPVPFATPKVMRNEPIIVSRPSFTDATAQPKSRGKGRGAAANAAAVPAANPNSFAARMMAKMGYVPGQGLGVTGQGILAPIEVKLRPQGAGVGAIKEKTEQAKAEARRTAALAGKHLSDSDSEKERKARKAKNKAARAVGGAGPGRSKKDKPKFKTADEIEKSAVGLQVPNILKDIIDMTGPEERTLSSAAGLLSTPTSFVAQRTPEEEEARKIARMARRELESYAAEWTGLQDRKSYMALEEERFSKDVDIQTEQVQRLSSIVELAKSLKAVNIRDEAGAAPSEEEAIWDLVKKLETIQFQFKDEISGYKLSELAVAALTPVIKQSIATWNPLSHPAHLTQPLQRLRLLLKTKTREDIEAHVNKRGHLPRPRKTATPYESLIYNIWLPRVRSAINNYWDVHYPAPLLALLEAWNSLLPPFIQANILDQLIVPKLKSAVTAWKPERESSSSSSKRNHTPPTPPPHLWIFPWLPFITTQPTHLPTLLAEIKNKLSQILARHKVALGPPAHFSEWNELLGHDVMEAMLIRHSLPALAAYLRSNLAINPADQDLTPLDVLWKWKGSFRVSVIAQLLTAEFFPKWLAVLREWLTSPEVVVGEVAEWYEFWKGVVPGDVASSPLVKAGFEKGLDLMNLAMDLGPGSERAKKELPMQEAGPQRPIKPAGEEGGSKRRERERAKEKEKKPQAKTAALQEQGSFRDAVEDWCTENNLLLIPLRKAHEKTGYPLFRITASASGAGGLVVYLQGDVVWAQDKKDRELFAPISLHAILEKVGA
ncbi:GC-rich sequence DNA-binding factor-like protein-domain-containing protein [Peziza echinospora]|nr:GC-rich sequence DNA-binding factor-like protein-domain-containing protein [Peziza echinospora]